MKIVFFHNDKIGVHHNELMDIPSSGTVLAMLNLSKGLTLIGNEVIILSNAETAVIDRIKYIKANEEESITWCRDNEYDVFISVGHAHTILDSIVLFNKGKIYHWHHNYLKIESVSFLLKRKKISGIICVSPHHMSSLYKYGFDSKYNYVRNSLDFELLEKIKISDNSRSGICYVGNVSVEKGFYEVINAYYDYYINGGREPLHIYGSTNLYEQNKSEVKTDDFPDFIIRKINELKKNNTIIFHGKKPRKVIYEELQKRKLLLCGLNKYGAAESAGMGMIEAQYFGCDVLTYNRGGQRDSVENKNSVIRIRSNVSYEIERSLKNYSPRIMSMTFRERYDMEKIALEWIKIFNKKHSFNKHINAISDRMHGVFFK
ncbi:glycosyltransferase [Citrobacter sp. JGM124]|uniref:glycosyltransferase n=1 Tax=Citrobacter sp. JGM124 TaxID=2799789 RepID=UPI001BAC77B9|nr:glycosyltransferase [Citrobacter sp. JGM124]MBS0847955.1 glycosyltransferase [Citrobacter sp. JGM124]